VKLEEIQESTRERILPSVSIDGGDIRAEKLEGNKVTFGAYAECAVCPACNEDYIWWLQKELKRHFNREITVEIVKKPSYFGN